MKRNLFTLVLLLAIINTVSAQQFYKDTQQSGFRNDNIFIGGSIGIGGGSGGFSFGANPEIGYSFNNWFDAGLAFNFNYTSQSITDVSNYNTKYRNTDFGAGVFARAWPTNFLFFQVQPEFNFIHYSTNYNNAGFVSSNTQAMSLLAGVGYGGKMLGSHYSYLVLMIDVMNNPNSPYRDYYNNIQPVFRGGFGFYLHPSKK